MADAIRLEKLGRVYVLTLLGDNEHRLTRPIVTAMMKALETVQNDEDAGALVTTNEGKFFSNGFDMKWVEDGTGDYNNYFADLLATYVNMNLPTIAAICGHACAAGFMLAMAHDHRCMRGDRGVLYMSEVDVQVRVNVPTMRVLKAAMSPKAFKDTFLLALKQKADDAHKAGLVDFVHLNSAETLKGAVAWATKLSDRRWNRSFYRTMRLDMNPEVLPGLLKLAGAQKGAPLHNQHPVLTAKL